MPLSTPITYDRQLNWCWTAPPHSAQVWGGGALMRCPRAGLDVDTDRSDLRDGVVLWFLRRAVEPDGQVLPRVREATHAGHPVGCPVSGVAVGFAGEECAAVPTVGLWVMSTNPTRLVMSVSSLMDQHFPGVACIRSTEYSATGSGPFLQALMWVSRSISQPPAGQRGEGRGEQLLDVMRVPVV